MRSLSYREISRNSFSKDSWKSLASNSKITSKCVKKSDILKFVESNADHLGSKKKLWTSKNNVRFSSKIYQKTWNNSSCTKFSNNMDRLSVWKFLSMWIILAKELVISVFKIRSPRRKRFKLAPICKEDKSWPYHTKKKSSQEESKNPKTIICT